MTEKELQEIKERWEITAREVFEYALEKQYIDNALMDIPNLIAEVERLRKENEELEEEVEELEKKISDYEAELDEERERLLQEMVGVFKKHIYSCSNS